MSIAMRARLAFAPPRYLAPDIAGIDLSTSGIKVVRLVERVHGLELGTYGEVRLPAGACAEGEIMDHAAVVTALKELATTYGVTHTYASLPESKSYLFETPAEGADKNAWMTEIEPKLDELIPLSPADATFDVTAVGTQGANTLLCGIGYARRVVESLISAFDEAGITIHALEGENFSLARALLHQGDPSTVLVIDIGKSTTKIAVIAGGIPRYATTVGIGGHSLTLAVQKHFGVTEEEAKKIKAERGIVPSPGNEDYIAAMLSTVSAVRDEIAQRLTYWQSRASSEQTPPVSRAILVGGNASLRGLPEYLEGALRIPVETGDVFTNLASRDYWLPPLDYMPSLAYGTAIGLALRSYAT